MVKVDDFRKYHLYQRSLALSQYFYNVAVETKHEYRKSRVERAYWIAVEISSTIANAISQVNIKIRFKKLNEAKDLLKELTISSDELREKNMITDHDQKQIESLIIEVLKLMNAYFRFLSEGKSENKKEND